MKTLVHLVLAVACVLAFCGIAVAKGSGGGHRSGGHGGHGSGGHGGHASGGARHGSSSHGTGARRASSGAARATAATGAASRQTSSRRTAGGLVVGTAVPRTPSSSLAGPLPFTRLVPFYAGPGFGYGHRLFYDPKLFGSGYPSYAYGYRPRAAYSGVGYAPDPFGRDGPTGGIRLTVEPRSAVVVVDGYYAGVVDDFDGHFQHLDLAAGPHHLEISAPGYESLGIDVVIQARHKIEYRGTLIRARP